MTRREAIKILEHLKPSNQVYNANDAYAVGQALCMAINSLEIDEAYQLESEKPTTKNNLGVDAISREDALDCVNWGYCFSDIYKKINELPSVTPQEPFDNRPCISSKVCEHDKQKVLDKIRADIEEIELLARYTRGDIKQMALDVIDKHKAESEDT